MLPFYGVWCMVVTSDDWHQQSNLLNATAAQWIFSLFRSGCPSGTNNRVHSIQTKFKSSSSLRTFTSPFQHHTACMHWVASMPTNKVVVLLQVQNIKQVKLRGSWMMLLLQCKGSVCACCPATIFTITSINWFCLCQMFWVNPPTELCKTRFSQSAPWFLHCCCGYFLKACTDTMKALTFIFCLTFSNHWSELEATPKPAQSCP